MHTFETPRPIHLRVEIWDGSITVIAEDTSTTTVELEATSEAPHDLVDQVKVEQRADEVVVLLPKLKSGLFRRANELSATIHVPLRSSAKLVSASADIRTVGELAEVKASSGSGDVQLERIGAGDVRTGSGDMSIDTVIGSLDVKGGSADIRIGTVGADADIMSGSGDVVVDSVVGPLKVKSGSGDIVVKAGGDSIDAMAGSGDLLFKRVDHGRVSAKTGSGDVVIGVAGGTAAYLDILTVSGQVRSELNGSDEPSSTDATVEINVKSGSGDVVLQRS